MGAGAQVRDNDVMRRCLLLPGRRRGCPLLDRVLQLGAEPSDLRLLQPGLPGGLQEHAPVRVPVLLQLLGACSSGALRVAHVLA